MNAVPVSMGTSAKTTLGQPTPAPTVLMLAFGAGTKTESTPGHAALRLSRSTATRTQRLEFAPVTMKISATAKA